MTNEQIEQTIREYIPQIIHMSLATVADNKPWVCEVHFSYDDELNLYFRSIEARRHSKELALNPHVAGNIVTQHHKNQKVRGVYFEGTAEKLASVSEDDAAYKAVHARYGNATIQAVTAEENTPCYYKITVQNWYLLDGYESDPAQKYTLPWKS